MVCNSARASQVTHGHVVEARVAHVGRAVARVATVRGGPVGGVGIVSASQAATTHHSFRG